MTAKSTSFKKFGSCAASTSLNLMLYGFSTISRTVAVMPAPSLSLMKPCCSKSINALASLVVSLGTAMTTPFAFVQAVKPAASATVKTTAMIAVRIFFIFIFSLVIFKIDIKKGSFSASHLP